MALEPHDRSMLKMMKDSGRSVSSSVATEKEAVVRGLRARAQARKLRDQITIMRKSGDKGTAAALEDERKATQRRAALQDVKARVRREAREKRTARSRR